MFSWVVKSDLGGPTLVCTAWVVCAIASTALRNNNKLALVKAVDSRLYLFHTARGYFSASMTQELRPSQFSLRAARKGH